MTSPLSFLATKPQAPIFVFSMEEASNLPKHDSKGVFICHPKLFFSFDKDVIRNCMQQQRIAFH
jgi:hypothetical protein